MKWGQIYLSSNKNHWTKWSLHFPYVNLISNAILYVTYEFSIQEEHDKRLSPSCINHAFTFPFHNSISIMMIKQTIRKWSKLWSICWKDALKIIIYGKFPWWFKTREGGVVFDWYIFPKSFSFKHARNSEKPHNVNKFP